jgi:hypothetical protein
LARLLLMRQHYDRLGRLIPMLSKADKSSASANKSMAIFVPGMRCSISDQAIKSADDAVMFPAFVGNQDDPLHVFSDAVVHVEAFRKHPLATKAQARYEEFRQRTAPKARLCFICGKQITDPDDYLGLGYLVDDVNHPLNRFNYAHLHRSCLAEWSELPTLIHSLETFDQSGMWKGDGLKSLIKELRKANSAIA